MSNVLTFTPRPRPVAPVSVPALTGGDLRTRLEEAAQTALDAAERLIAILDGLDGDPDAEDVGDTEPDLGAPEGHASQIGWLRGTTRDFEIDRQPEQRP